MAFGATAALGSMEPAPLAGALSDIVPSPLFGSRANNALPVQKIAGNLRKFTFNTEFAAYPNIRKFREASEDTERSEPTGVQGRKHLIPCRLSLHSGFRFVGRTRIPYVSGNSGSPSVFAGIKPPAGGMIEYTSPGSTRLLGHGSLYPSALSRPVTRRCWLAEPSPSTRPVIADCPVCLPPDRLWSWPELNWLHLAVPLRGWPVEPCSPRLTRIIHQVAAKLNA